MKRQSERLKWVIDSWPSTLRGSAIGKKGTGTPEIIKSKQLHHIVKHDTISEGKGLIESGRVQ